MTLEFWDVWYPEAASRGLLFASGAMDESDACWLHAAPDVVRVEVRDALGNRTAVAEGLRREGPRLPMTLLKRKDGGMTREDRWPGPDDFGLPVLLPGGEIGILRAWWNAEDGSAWRWTVEFENRL